MGFTIKSLDGQAVGGAGLGVGIQRFGCGLMADTRRRFNGLPGCHVMPLPICRSPAAPSGGLALRSALASLSAGKRACPMDCGEEFRTRAAFPLRAVPPHRARNRDPPGHEWWLTRPVSASIEPRARLSSILPRCGVLARIGPMIDRLLHRAAEAAQAARMPLGRSPR